jgi:hypothetical protein
MDRAQLSGRKRFGAVAATAAPKLDIQQKRRHSEEHIVGSPKDCVCEWSQQRMGAVPYGTVTGSAKIFSEIYCEVSMEQRKASREDVCDEWRKFSDEL